MEQAELASVSSWLNWLSLIKYIGGAMVVVGVAAELLGDWFSEPLQKKLDDARKLEIAQLTTEGQRLSKEAETARSSIAAANERAAEAQLALEKLKAPRSLSRFQTMVLADKLRPFARTRFDLSVIIGDPEAIGFLGVIAGVLQAAGWEWVEYNHPSGPFMNVYNVEGKPNIGQQGWQAISIQVFDDHAAELSPAADTLLAALKGEGVVASRDKASDAIPNHDTIHILVGRKPL
ncbi:MULTISPECIES: hypothetical protein [unclassified Bradyrhizobium]|uniref:hypothetical protein n=1 Tax=unclassified Bradyrhizobium TaxID=2631580 RepID=UPI002915FA94|nr:MULTISPECIES: hypothetical protein [unclassified Bradyrhizobium]